MRKRFTLDSTTPTIPVSLDFRAEVITIYNPTPNLVAVRIGSTGVPSSVAVADMWLGPYLAESYPVEGASFGLALVGRRGALEFDDALPASVLVTFTRDEPPPSYSAVDFSQLATESVVVNQATNIVAGVFGDGPFTVPANMRTLHLTGIDAGMLDILVLGAQSGLFYINGGSPWTEDRLQSTPFFPALDSSVFVIGNSGGAGQYTLVASAGVVPGGSYDSDRMQRVRAQQEGAWAVAAVTTRASWPALALLALAVRAATSNAAINLGGAGPCLTVLVRVTVRPGAETLTPQLNDPGNLANFWQAAATIGAPGLYAYHFGPGVTAAPNLATIESYPMPVPDGALWTLAHSGAGNWTYSVTAYRSW